MNFKQHVSEQFNTIFGYKPDRFFLAPGRVNLIGEHTDYNGGHVFPCALDFGTYGAVCKRADNKIRIASGNFENICEINEISLNGIVHDTEDTFWANYPKGVLVEILKEKHTIGGFDLYIWGNIPQGAGLSSSASVELLTGEMLNALFDCKIPLKELVLLCQKAENNFVGVNCGIMDQYAVGFGKKDNAILLNCQSISHNYIPLSLNDYIIMITNSNNDRSLASSEYNQRRSECEAALAILQKECDANFLCELDIKTFEGLKHLIKDPILLKRATHAIYENARTLQAITVLSYGDIKTFGQLMNDSHTSLKTMYEVTGKELDILAEAAQSIEGVLGSRMTGAGFGGCTVTILHKNNIDLFKQSVSDIYHKETGLTPTFYTANVGNGVQEI